MRDLDVGTRVTAMEERGTSIGCKPVKTRQKVYYVSIRHAGIEPLARLLCKMYPLNQSVHTFGEGMCGDLPH
jgi:hypothetical protein